MRARLSQFALAGRPLDAAQPVVIAGLLEEGDSSELGWLIARVGEPALADWLSRRGGRQLSRRSRSFWELALGRRASAPAPLAAELWPL